MIPALSNVEASCAICGGPSIPECPHESQRLELALNQAMYRWSGFDKMRNWVLDHARDTILTSFATQKRARHRAHLAHLQTLPCFSLYQKFRANLSPSQCAQLEAQIHHANDMYKAGIDDDWRRSCLTYPKVLDYFFEMVEVEWPEEGEFADGAVRLSKGLKGRRRSRSRGSAHSVGSDGSKVRKKDSSNRQRDRRRRRGSRGRTPTGLFGDMRM